MAVLAATILTIIDHCITATMDMELRSRAFVVARENMERLLGRGDVAEMTEVGQDELNPAIEWQTIVEPFYEPVNNRMWVRAICSASYVDSRDETQTITLTHWLCRLSDQQAARVEKQRQIEQQYVDMLSENDAHLQWQQVVRRYLADRGMDAAAYDRLLTEQKNEKQRWIQQYKEYNPDVFNPLLEEMYTKEEQWLAEMGFDPVDFDQWKTDNADVVAEIYSRPPIFYGAVAHSTGAGGTGTGVGTSGAGSGSTSSGSAGSSGSGATSSQGTSGEGAASSENFGLPANWDSMSNEERWAWLVDWFEKNRQGQ